MKEDARALAGQYRKMSELELMDLAKRYDDLAEPAQALLREEFRQRSLEPPLLDEPEPEFVERKMVTVAKYRDLSEAIVARSVLEAADIACFLRDENTVRMDWLWSNLLGGLRLQVATADVERAEDLLAQQSPRTIDLGGGEEFRSPVCPQCGSDEIVLHDPGVKTGAVALLLTGLPLRMPPSSSPEEVWRCLQCGCKWVDDGEPGT